VKTLHTAYRVTDLAVSLDFYSALGYQELGRVDMGEGASLTMLKFPGEEVVTLELVHRPADGWVQVGTGFSHLVVQVDELAATIEALTKAGLQPGPEQLPAGRSARGPRGSPTPTATGSSSCSGHPGIPTGSAPPTSPSPTVSRGSAHFPGRTDRDRRADLGRRSRDYDLGRIRDRGEWRRQP
jgi:lactoylglutathione lyase